MKVKVNDIKLTKVVWVQHGAEEVLNQLKSIDGASAKMPGFELALAVAERDEATFHHELATARVEKAEAQAYELKLAAAGGEDAPGSANAVTVADVERWQKEHEATVRELSARANRIERETIERCAKVVEEAMVGDVDSEITRGAADAYNDTNPHAMVHERLERMGQFIAAAIRAMRESKG
jgi:hypothetical protein